MPIFLPTKVRFIFPLVNSSFLNTLSFWFLDIDECKLEVPVCLPGTQCHNVQGSYKCIPMKKHNVEKGQCPLGFSRNIDNHACDGEYLCFILFDRK